jgi:Domain of unknown function (DUF4304)
MPIDAVTKAFRNWGNDNGFRRKGATLYRERCEVMAVINLQGSQWGGAKYINVSWWLLALGQPNDPAFNRCHIRARLDTFVPDVALLTKVLRDDSELSDVERIAHLDELLDNYLSPHLAATETVAQIKRNDHGWLDRVGVTAAAREALTSANHESRS